MQIFNMLVEGVPKRQILASAFGIPYRVLYRAKIKQRVRCIKNQLKRSQRFKIKIKTIESRVFHWIQTRLESLNDMSEKKKKSPGCYNKQRPRVNEIQNGGMWTNAKAPLFLAGPHASFMAAVCPAIQPATVGSTKSGRACEFGPGEFPPGTQIMR
jgi:hypothetical protein